MTDTAVSPPNEPLAPPAPPAPPAPASTDGFFLDGAAPRLGDAAPAVPPRAEPIEGTTAEPTPAMAPPPPPAPMAPAGEATAPAAPAVDAADLPSLPTAAPAVPATIEDAAGPDAESSGENGDHPLAHLMPSKSAPSAAQQRAAELRAARKSKSKKIKIGVAVGALAVSALAGPPLVSWLTDAINEAGTTTSDDE